LPSFVDEKFLASTMHLVRSDIRRMHEERAWIRAVTGFAWPEEKPAVEDMPSIYLDALRYPAFAIAVQHQFFHDDYARGFPKNEIVRQFFDMSERIIDSKPMEPAEAHLSVVRSLHVLANGGDRHVVLADLMSLPGLAAWRARCSDATAGLEKLEARKDEIAEIGRYLRSVVGPFAGFADGKRTIGEVFESVVIPLALKLPVLAELPGEPEAAEDEAQIPRDGEEADVASQHTPSADNTPVSGPSVDEERGGIELAWNRHSSALKKLSDESIATGPNGSTTLQLRELVDVLEALHARAVLLVPPRQQTDALVSSLRDLIAKIAAALQSHIGEKLNADDISASLSGVAAEVEAERHDAAELLAGDAASLFSRSEAVAAEIVQLEADLPMKVARERTAPLVELREQHLKDALVSAGNSVGTLLAGSDAPSAPPELGSLPQIKIVKLRPWSRSFLGTRVDAIQLPGDLVDRIYEKTGGWNEIVDPLMTRISDKPSEVAALVSAASQDAVSSPALLPDLGISQDLLGFFKELALYADGSTITTTDFQYLCTSDGRGISSGIVGTYSDLLGILSFPPNQGGEQVHRKVDLNPMVLAALLRTE
jgi:hypothetical protein